MYTEKRAQITAVNEALNRTNDLYSTWAKRHGLNYHTLMVLYALDSADGCTQKQISRAWLIPKQTVNTILTAYRERGYVTFTGAEADRREKIVRFTEQGQAYANTVLQELYALEERVMERMGEKLCAQLVLSNQMYCRLFEEACGHA